MVKYFVGQVCNLSNEYIDTSCKPALHKTQKYIVFLDSFAKILFCWKITTQKITKNLQPSPTLEVASNSLCEFA